MDYNKKLEIRKRLRKSDILIWICFGMGLVVKFFSVFMFIYLSENIESEIGSNIENVITTLEGNPLMEVNGKSTLAMEGDIFEIPHNTLHRFSASDNEVKLIEFSTHHEDSDSYRI